MKTYLLQFIGELLGEEIDETGKLGDPESWDSLFHLVLISELEVKFDTFFTDEEIERGITLVELAAILKSKVGEEEWLE